MSICSSGISVQKTGTNDNIVLGPGVLADLASRYGVSWLGTAFIGAGISNLPLYLPTFCAVDPPADPGLSGVDMLALVTLGPGPLTTSATAKMVQLLQRYAWYDFCQCASVATPAPPAAPSAPAGIPAIDPPQQVGYGTVTPCIDITQASTTQNVGAGRFINTYNYHYFDGVSLGTLAPVTSMAFKHTPQQTTGSGSHIAVKVDQRDANNNIVLTSTMNINTGTTQTLYVNRSALSTSVDWQYTVLGGTGSVTVVDLEWFAYCDGQVPNSTASPCCPPDPIASAKLDSILQLLTLVQRQLAPFAYVSGTAHHSLSGNGSVAVSDVLGVLLNVSVPSRAGVEVGDPNTVFDCGWINFGTADGWSGQRPIRSDSQVVFPEVAGAYVLVGYTLLPGVTMTLTELLREP